MKLAVWLSTQNRSDADFARALKISRQALFRYKSGERTPRPEIMLRIQEVTGGQVSLADFVDEVAA